MGVVRDFHACFARAFRRGTDRPDPHVAGVYPKPIVIDRAVSGGNTLYVPVIAASPTP